MHDVAINTKRTKTYALPRKANDCIADVKAFKPPGKLFDAFWRQDELALLFGAPATGKTVLAVQIADALASGEAIDGFKMPDEGQKVLYVDLVHSDEQFHMRRAAED